MPRDGSDYEGSIPKPTLISRNITIFGKRTSIRLEPEMWEGLKDVANREQCRVHDVCSLISARKRDQSSLTAAIRVFIMLYFKAAATEDGHKRAGHGNFNMMKKRARLEEEKEAFFNSNRRKGRDFIIDKNLDLLKIRSIPGLKEDIDGPQSEAKMGRITAGARRPEIYSDDSF